MRKAVVTGANGFVGSAVCRELSSRGVEVTAIVRDETEPVGSIAGLGGVSVAYCDMSRFRRLAGEAACRGADVFYHFAWAGSAGSSRCDADLQIGNVQQTCDAVRACSDMGCGRFVFAASIMEYEVGALMSTSEAPPASSLYSSAKVAADYMARAVAGSLGVDYIRAVISNVYGPGETSPRLVNSSLRKMVAGERCSFSPGEQMYDFIYVSDAARAFAELGEGGRPNRAYYIGSPNPRPLRDFLLEMRDCVDPALEIGLGDLPFGGVALKYDELDTGALREDTGFVPEVPFSEGVMRTAAWLKEGR